MGTSTLLAPSYGRERSRWLSALEFLLGAAIVIGHNVYRKLPNEVPILFALGLVSLTIRDGWLAGQPSPAASKLRAVLGAISRGFQAIGLRRPASWRRTVSIALAAAALRILLGNFVIEPITGRFWPPAKGPSEASDIPGHPLYALLALAFVWVFAAFGEEIGYRGYLLTRGADIGNRSTAAYWASMLIVSVLFGYGHYYKGPAGIVDSGLAGLILGAAYLLGGRNLWVAILGHGFIDTFVIIAVYFGLNS
jgi:membrane protease YdiL (CAAX protease family)